MHEHETEEEKEVRVAEDQEYLSGIYSVRSRRKGRIS